MLETIVILVLTNATVAYVAWILGGHQMSKLLHMNLEAWRSQDERTLLVEQHLHALLWELMRLRKDAGLQDETTGADFEEERAS